MIQRLMRIIGPMTSMISLHSCAARTPSSICSSSDSGRSTSRRFDMQLTDFKVLTFDCYGTLIDWESGMFEAYKDLVAKSRTTLTRDQILETHARNEADQEAKTPTMLYAELLGVVHARVAREWSVETTAEENAR